MVVVGLSYRPRRGPRGTEAILVGLRAKRANDAAGLKEEEGDAEAGVSQARALWPRQGGEKYGQFFNVHFAKIGLLPRRLLWLVSAPSCSLASSFAFTVVDQVQGPISSLHLILFIMSPICVPAYNMITEQVMAICIRTACVTSLVFFRARPARPSLTLSHHSCRCCWQPGRQLATFIARRPPRLRPFNYRVRQSLSRGGGGGPRSLSSTSIRRSVSRGPPCPALLAHIYLLRFCLAGRLQLTRRCWSDVGGMVCGIWELIIALVHGNT